MQNKILNKTLLILAVVIAALSILNLFLFLSPFPFNTKNVEKNSVLKFLEWFFEQPKEESEKVAELKELSQMISQKIESGLENMKKKIDLDEANLTEDEEKELLSEFQESKEKDFKWILERKNNLMKKIEAENSLEKVNELTAEEVSLLLLSNYVAKINQKTIQDCLENFSEKEIVVENALVILKKIKTRDFLSKEIIEETAKETKLEEELIREKFNALMEEFVQKKKMDFTKTIETKNFVEAQKLINLFFLFGY